MSEYYVELNTELGKKVGTLQLFTHGAKADGFLTILQHREPFFGDINEDGTCRLQGKIVTLLHEIAYVATGEIDSEKLLLHMQMERANYVLTGFACTGE